MNTEQENQRVTVATTYTLADLRRVAGLSQAEMAKALGRNPSQISRIEAQFPDVNFSTVQAYLKVLGGHIVVTEWNLGELPAECLQADPARQEALARRRADPHRGFRSGPAEELPLKQRDPDTGGDDTGR